MLDSSFVMSLDRLFVSVLFSVLAAVFSLQVQADTFVPYETGQSVPDSVETLWAEYDPRAEPLEVELLHEFEQDGVVMQVLRYRVGVFKGQTAMLAAIYGYPKEASHLPGLVQIHGGGQYADYRAVLTNAKRGYATLSIAWAGRLNAPDYHVNPAVVQLFFNGKVDDPNYKLTTDWGALEGYHAPSRFKSGNVYDLEPAEWTIDPVESPRNSAWFLWTMGARRGLTFLEQRPEVDADRLGVYGHSMGGKLTVLTAGSDARVKAAAPSCGGISNRQSKSELYIATIGDAAYLKRVECPIFFLSPSNDFHGLINDVPTAVNEIQTDQWRVNSSPHHNHQDTAPYEVATQLWMDRILQGGKVLPETPAVELQLATSTGIPTLQVFVDAGAPIESIDVYYTQQGTVPSPGEGRDAVIHRYWHHGKVMQQGEHWLAELPVFSAEQPLWAYANVSYALEEPVQGAGYYYGEYCANRYVLSSLLQTATAADLQAATVVPALQRSMQIEDFQGDWKQGWFSYSKDPENWGVTTHKIYDPVYAAPEGTHLAFDVRVEQANLLVLGLDDAAVAVKLDGRNQWQTVRLSPEDFQRADGSVRSDWRGIKELRLGQFEQLRAVAGEEPLELGGKHWNGPAPAFRNLRWETETHE